MKATLLLGDCLDRLEEIESNSVDAILTDPPYGLSDKMPDMAEVLTHWLNGDDYAHRGGGFMGQSWDSFVPGPAVWREVYRVLKPGGSLMAFGGSRTFDLLTLAIRLAGFQIRDCLSWLYGSGFPKNYDISKGMDKAAGAERTVIGEYVWPDNKPRNTKIHQTKRNLYYDIKSDASQNDRSITAPSTPDAQKWDGYGTALKPAWEPIIWAMKPVEGGFVNNALTWGVAGVNIDKGRIGLNGEKKPIFINGVDRDRDRSSFDTGGSNRTGDYSNQGRWPANVILDETAAGMLDEQSGELRSGGSGKNNNNGTSIWGTTHRRVNNHIDLNEGGASRFFYVAKASKAERNLGLKGMPERVKIYNGTSGESSKDLKPVEKRFTTKTRNDHPTVKPVDLLVYLAGRLKPPEGGVILDPFMGSGTTGMAAVKTGWAEFIGIEIGEWYYEIAARRISWAQENWDLLEGSELDLEGVEVERGKRQLKLFE